MTLHADGRIEGTPAEIAAYLAMRACPAKTCDACPVREALIKRALEDTARHIAQHPPFVLPEGWDKALPRPQVIPDIHICPSTVWLTAFPASPQQIQDWYDRCPCNPKNGGSGACGCVKPWETSMCVSVHEVCQSVR